MPTTNFRITYINLADSAVLSASPVATSTMPVTYLQNSDRGDVMLAVAAGTQAILGNWSGTAYTISHVRLDRTNLADGDTWRIQLYSDAAQVTQVYDSGTIAAFTTGLFTQNGKSWNFTFAELYLTAQTGVKSFKITVVTAGIFMAARLFMGAYTQATYNPKYGMANGWGSNHNQVRTDGGSNTAQTKSQWRTLAFDMFLMNEPDRALWNEIGRYSGKVASVAISVYPGAGGTLERDFSILGKFEDSPSYVINNNNKYDYSLKLNED